MRQIINPICAPIHKRTERPVPATTECVAIDEDCPPLVLIGSSVPSKSSRHGSTNRPVHERLPHRTLGIVGQCASCDTSRWPTRARQIALIRGSRRVSTCLEPCRDKPSIYRVDLNGYPCRMSKRQAELVRATILPAFLIAAKDQGKRFCSCGALGNKLLNYSGIGPELLKFIVDCHAYRHGRHTPGRHIPTSPTEAIEERNPDHIVILPGNLKDEIFQADGSRACPQRRFVIPSPPADVMRSRWSVS